jgi:hypothetical protein
MLNLPMYYGIYIPHCHDHNCLFKVMCFDWLCNHVGQEYMMLQRGIEPLFQLPQLSSNLASIQPQLLSQP